MALLDRYPDPGLGRRRLCLAGSPATSWSRTPRSAAGSAPICPPAGILGRRGGGAVRGGARLVDAPPAYGDARPERSAERPPGREVHIGGDADEPDRSAPSPTRASACPHDCPSTCALEVEVLDAHTIGRVRGAKDNDYTAGVICAKVARYAERMHHPDASDRPAKRRTGAKGAGELETISWDDALDLVAEAFLKAERRHGAEAVWPYYYAGTMGLVMRDGINRLRHAKKYSGFHSTICVNPACTGFVGRHRAHRRARPARDGEVRPGGDLGHQPGQHPGQRDDPCDARPQGARRQDRRRSTSTERHHGAGRPAGADPSRHRRCARLRRDALPVPRRPRGLGLSRALHRRAARARRARAARRTPQWAAAITGCDGRDDRGVRAR